MKIRTIKEEVSKDFLLTLLEPFHPTLKPRERITDINFENNLETIIIKYHVVEGGVKNS